jgi:hypothetical protein
MQEFTINVVGGLVSALIGVGIGVLLTRTKYARKMGHLMRLIPVDRRVQVVLPSARVGEFLVKEENSAATFPPNVLIMPMAEGIGIAQLVLAIRSVRRSVKIDFTTDDAVGAGYSLTISIGGPSVNLESRRLLGSHPQFRLNYPEHTASYGNQSYIPKRDPDGGLREDFGFLFTCRSPESLSLVCCGVWGMGTEAAIRGFLDLKHHKQAHVLRSRNQVFMAFHTKIDGLRASPPELIYVASETRSATWK